MTMNSMPVFASAWALDTSEARRTPAIPADSPEIAKVMKLSSSQPTQMISNQRSQGRLPPTMRRRRPRQPPSAVSDLMLPRLGLRRRSRMRPPRAA